MSDIRTAYATIITSGAYLVLPLLAIRFNHHNVWIGTFVAVSAISFFAWLSANRRRLAIDDYPTARVASAPQGYVELSGTCRIPPGSRPVSRRGRDLALGIGYAWFRYRIDEKTGNGKWHTVDSGCSDQDIMLDDGTGQCYIDPGGAEVVTDQKEVWYEGDYRHTEWYILPNDRLYAIGQFQTVGGGGLGGVTDADMHTLLADWKRDQASLIARFDKNGDGQIDIEEWEEVRKAARKELSERYDEEAVQPGIPVMAKPEDGRLFLLSNLEPGKLTRRYLLWAWFHLTVFVSSGAAAAGIATGVVHL